MCSMPQTKKQSTSAKDDGTSNTETVRFPTFHLLWGQHIWALLDQAMQKWIQMLWWNVYIHGKQGSTYRNHSQFEHRLLYSGPKESHCLEGKYQLTLFSDNGSNFIGCEKELKKGIWRNEKSENPFIYARSRSQLDKLS